MSHNEQIIILGPQFVLIFGYFIPSRKKLKIITMAKKETNYLLEYIYLLKHINIIY